MPDTTPTLMTTKLTLGSIVALFPLVGALFLVDSRYLSADDVVHITDQLDTIEANQTTAAIKVGHELDYNYAKLRIGLAEIRVELYQDKLDSILLMPEDEITDYHRKRVVVLERGVAKYEKIIEKDSDIMGIVD
jgi:hypothetical protein